MDVEEYWIGRNVDYDGVWTAYVDGSGYINKFWSMRTHALRITLAQPSQRAPIFNFEAVYKTFKGYFHDLKHACLSPDEYNRAGPLFIYSVDRGSGIWTFLGELRQLLLFGTTLADEQLMGQRRRYFGDQALDPDSFAAFAEAKTPSDLDRALRKLFEQGLEKVEISKLPFTGDIRKIEASFVELKQITKDVDRS